LTESLNVHGLILMFSVEKPSPHGESAGNSIGKSVGTSVGVGGRRVRGRPAS
jgi:hypothetical protein